MALHDPDGRLYRPALEALGALLRAVAVARLKYEQTPRDAGRYIEERDCVAWCRTDASVGYAQRFEEVLRDLLVHATEEHGGADVAEQAGALLREFLPYSDADLATLREPAKPRAAGHDSSARLPIVTHTGAARAIQAAHRGRVTRKQLQQRKPGRGYLRRPHTEYDLTAELPRWSCWVFTVGSSQFRSLLAMEAEYYMLDELAAACRSESGGGRPLHAISHAEFLLLPANAEVSAPPAPHE